MTVPDHAAEAYVEKLEILKKNCLGQSVTLLGELTSNLSKLHFTSKYILKKTSEKIEPNHKPNRKTNYGFHRAPDPTGGIYTFNVSRQRSQTKSKFAL